MYKPKDNGSSKKKIQCYSYNACDKIGRGYSSQVFKGKNDITNEQVAIKVIDMKMIKGETHKTLLQDQTDVLKSFQSPQNVIEVFDIFRNRQSTFIITQYCKDGDLSKIIKHGLSQTEAVAYLKQIVAGYMEICRKRIIHRDLKPANILLKSGKIKIADFGFATKQLENQKRFSYNVGSPIYMPPEALNQNIYSFKSDIWAIGIIFFEMLTGKTPWKAKTQKDLGKMLKAVPIEKVLPKNISEQSAQFLIKTLTINPQQRLNPYQLQDQVRYFSSSDITKCKSSSILKHIPQKYENINDRTYSSSKNSLKKLTKMNFYQPVSRDDQKGCSLPKTAATIKNKTEKDLAPIIDIKQTSKEVLSQIHFFRFTYKLAQRINKNQSNELELKNFLTDNMFNLVLIKIDQIKKLHLLENSKRKSYEFSDDFVKIKKIIDQYEQKYERQVSLFSKKRTWEGYEKLKDKIMRFLKQSIEEVKENEDESRDEQYTQKMIIIDYLITFKQLIDLQETGSLGQFHLSSEIQKIVEGNPVKMIKREHIKGIMSKWRKIQIR